MINSTSAPEIARQSSSSGKEQRKKHLKVNEINYRLNLDSNYTEKIRELDKSFNYETNKDHYWSEPELSLLYGTSFYNEASPSQKLALNHLYWAAMYEYIAASEGSTILYNDVTAGLFAALGGYETLCQELALESEQERPHIHVFQKISYQTKLALLGKTTLRNSWQKSPKLKRSGWVKKLIPQSLLEFFTFNWASSPFSVSQYSSIRLITKMMLKNSSQNYSLYLKDWERKKQFPAASTTGYLGVAFPRPLLQLLTLNWGISPFLACQYYAYRFAGNMGLKVYEYQYVKYLRDLEKRGEFIPTPTAVSYYHFLDESFHTTTSQLMARDIYQEFPAPTIYEQLLGNWQIYMMQRGFLSGLSGGLQAVFRSDVWFMPLFYKILRSPLFELSERDALYWLEKCLCQEHEGFELNLKYHQRLRSDLLRLFGQIDYLWPVNRELRLMQAGASIDKAIQHNVKALRRFSRVVLSDS